ncbi:MAG: mannose-1-phosphate guanylyltransferase/mannose-6-phosphate isomerase [Sulfuritalea sp.]|nr:mannose-1-phosphate guanylyltransferase/mannose-6-phosphate isomerase [Sulfuritalea sp.]
MQSSSITPVVLCGGSGTRLWPLSRKSFPKQFVPLIDNKSLLQLTLERVALLSTKVICVASDEHRFFVAEAMQSAHVQGTVLLEPVARNTAAAMAIATLLAEPEELLLFCPSDHHIPDAATFAQVIQSGVKAALSGAIVTFGINPTFPSTAYGYIRQGAARSDGSFNVEGFTEKPAKDKAQALLITVKALWNAGIFLCTAQTLLQALDKHAPDILKACQIAITNKTIDASFVRPEPESFASCRSESIDYAVMEHFANVVVIPFIGAWSDVGSWSAVSEMSPADEDGNRIQGQGIALHSANTFIHAPGRTVVALGTQNLLIIDTPDALLVAASSHAEQVKEVVARLEADGIQQSAHHKKVPRPWGSFDSVDVGERHQVKRITVKPGAKLSLQKHHHRAEHWIVVSGTALVTKGEETLTLTENQSTYIPLGVTHRLENPGQTNLELIEVQSGSYLGEDDIVRFEDAYGRAAGTPKV